MRRTLAWLKRRWHLLLLGLFLLTGIELFRRGRVLRTLRDELALARARQAVAHLRATRDAAGELADANQNVIDRIDAEIQAQRIAAVRAYEEGQKLEGRALEHAFEELGF